MSFRFRVLTRADRDIDNIYVWLADRSQVGAAKWADRLDDTFDQVAATPFSFGLAPEADVIGDEIRQALFKTRRGRRYRVLFIVRDNEVIVLRVRGAREAPVQPDDLDLDAADS